LLRRIAALLGLALFICGSHVAVADEAPAVHIALVRDATAAPLLIAVAQGYVKDAGLDARLVFQPSDVAVAAAVAEGKADFGLAGLSASFFGFAASHRLKLIAARSYDETGFPLDALLISAKARIAGFTGPRGLAHRRIGILNRDRDAYPLFALASRAGLDFAAIDRVALPSLAAAQDALSRGTIDALFLPYRVALRERRRGETLQLPSDFAPSQQGVVFTAAATIQTRRDLVARFMRGYQQGTAEYQLNFLSYDDAGDFIAGPRYDAELRMVAHAARLPPALLAMTKSYCDRRANLDSADIARQVRFWQAQGRLDKSIDPADLVDLSFIGAEAATEELSAH
jgi:NitT/TauT family transport system substrate-binding protein